MFVYHPHLTLAAERKQQREAARLQREERDKAGGEKKKPKGLGAVKLQ